MGEGGCLGDACMGHLALPSASSQSPGIWGTRHPRGSLTGPHPDARASTSLFPDFLTDPLVGDARPVFSFQLLFLLLPGSPHCVLA